MFKHRSFFYSQETNTKNPPSPKNRQTVKSMSLPKSPQASTKPIPQSTGPQSDLASGVRIENGVRIKTLPPSVVKDIEQKNIARRLASISPILIRVRRCLACGSLFESSGNRTCGCSSRSAGMIAGREII